MSLSSNAALKKQRSLYHHYQGVNVFVLFWGGKRLQSRTLDPGVSDCLECSL